ncbi:MAG: DUF1289 domain-containing protein [Paracoccaceae bacterium]|nr:DUF1289 domain-containing protein [Paracoccaceae bacterium]
MTDEVWKREEIASPCVKVCMIHRDAKICVGCNRTADEIARWAAMGPEARAAVLAELPGRSAQLTVRRGGRRRA